MAPSSPYSMGEHRGMWTDCFSCKASWRNSSNDTLSRAPWLERHRGLVPRLLEGSLTIGTISSVTPSWMRPCPAASKNIPAGALASRTLKKCLYKRIWSWRSSVRKRFASRLHAALYNLATWSSSSFWDSIHSERSRMIYELLKFVYRKSLYFVLNILLILP